MASRFFISVLILTCGLGACTQAPAEVVYGSSQTSGKRRLPEVQPISQSSSQQPIDLNATTHIVQVGETLASIARNYQMNWKELAAANHIDPPYRLYAGRELTLNTTNNNEKPNSITLQNPSPQVPAPVDTEPTPQAVPIPQAKPIMGDQISFDNKNDHAEAAKPGELAHLPIPPNPYKAEDKSIASTDPNPSPTSAAAPIPQSKPKQPNHLTATQTATQATSKEFQSVTELTSSNIPANKADPRDRSFFGSGTPKFDWPLRGNITTRFGATESGIYNDGLNIESPENTDIGAAADGKVIYIGDRVKNYGNLLMIQHKGGFITSYAHTHQIFVNVGDKVKKGQVVASVGSSGNVKKPQLHFSIHKDTKAVDPETLLPN